MKRAVYIMKRALCIPDENLYSLLGAVIDKGIAMKVPNWRVHTWKETYGCVTKTPVYGDSRRCAVKRALNYEGTPWRVYT